MSRFDQGTLRALVHHPSCRPSRNVAIPLIPMPQLSIGGKRKKKADRLRQPMALMSQGHEGKCRTRSVGRCAPTRDPSRSNIYKEKKSKIPSQPCATIKLNPHLPICLVTAPPITVGSYEGVLSSHPPFSRELPPSPHLNSIAPKHPLSSTCFSSSCWNLRHMHVSHPSTQQPRHHNNPKTYFSLLL